MTILFIIESSGKVAKISKILGKNYIVKSSLGHFRDLDKKKMSIDFEKNFEPVYVITKPDVVRNLKSEMKRCDMVYLASDLDMEGEAIAESLHKTLKPTKYKRIRFNEISKSAIIKAIDNSSTIDVDIVNAQKARRVLDRLYGYLISPLLQRQIGGNLSAGRVQSVAAEIVIDKENSIKEFIEKNSDSTFFKVNGQFSGLKAVLHKSIDKNPHNTDTEYKGNIAHIKLNNTNKPHSDVTAFLKHAWESNFVVHSVSDKTAIRSAAPPFTTSTLQQEANRKFGLSVDLTMRIAQKLYEAGYITYMRTDSIDLSEEAHSEIKKVIIKEFGKEYYQKNIYKNKIKKNSQNAHEAIRPVHPDLTSLDKELGDSVEEKNQIKLYKLIWQRTIASQMKPAQINITTVQITISKYLDDKMVPYYYFSSQIEKIIFHGFMKIYVESRDDDVEEENDTVKNFSGKFPKPGSTLSMEEIVAKQEFLRPPCRYTEASLVKRLDKLGIGRPSTFVNSVKTIKDRGYVEISNLPGIKKDITIYTISSKKNDKESDVKNDKKNGKKDKENGKKNGKKDDVKMGISESKSTILLGKENKKIVPTGLGITVNDFLMEHFPEMMDYEFTAKIEKELDDIASGDKVWHKVVRKFYNKLNPIIEDLKKIKGIIRTEDRLLGSDEEGNEIYAIKTKHGPAVKKIIDSKSYYAKIDSKVLDTIKLKEAIKLLKYPIILGQFEGAEILLKKGESNFYLAHNKETYFVDPELGDNISVKQAIKIIKDKRANNIAVFEILEGKTNVTATVLAGKYGPYIAVRRLKTRKNYKIPKSIDPITLTKKQVKEIISQKKSTQNKKSYGGSKSTNGNKADTSSKSTKNNKMTTGSKSIKKKK